MKEAVGLEHMKRGRLEAILKDTSQLRIYGKMVKKIGSKERPQNI